MPVYTLGGSIPQVAPGYEYTNTLVAARISTYVDVFFSRMEEFLCFKEIALMPFICYSWRTFIMYMSDNFSQQLGGGPVEASLHPSIFKTSVHKLTVYGRPERSELQERSWRSPPRCAQLCIFC